MIASLTGDVAELTPNTCILQVHGVGYLCHIPFRVYREIKDQSRVTLFIYTYVRENALDLYGFLTQAERELFQRLLAISGVGPRVALALLSEMTPDEFGQCISDQDVRRLSRVPGIGPKTARRILVDFPLHHLPQAQPSPEDQIRRDALSALENLGYPLRKAKSALEEVWKEKSSWSLEELVVKTLQRLSP